MDAGQGTTVVKAGTELAERAGQIIRGLGETIGRGAQSSQQIAATAHQQSAGMDQIAQAMSETRQATQQVVAGAEETQNTVAALEQVARELGDVSGYFKVAAG